MRVLLVRRPFLRLFTSLALCAVVAAPLRSDVAVASAVNPRSVSFAPVTLVRAPHATHTSTLYVVGSVKCLRLPCLRLYRTHDAIESTIDPAPTFTPVTMPPTSWISGRATGSLLGLVFATPLIGYALEGSSEPEVLYATFNGAKTWQKLKIPSGDFIAGFSTTGNHLYALFLNCKKGNEGCVNFQMDHATLSGKKWSGVNIPFGSLDAGSLSGVLSAYGENVFISQSMKGRALLYVSHNGGLTFTKSAPQKLLSVAGCALTAVSAKEVWAMCPTGSLASIQFSNDAGRTWRSLNHKLYGSTSGGFFATAGYDFAYVDTGANPRNMYRINVGARQEHDIGELACSTTESAVFVSVFHGFAICYTNGSSPHLERTINGGVTWQRVSTTSTMG